MNVSCEEGTIVIIDGNFGRTRPDNEVCPFGSYHSDATDCIGFDSLERIKEECEGQTACSVPANSSFFGGDPCLGTYKYLETSYRCQWCTIRELNP